MARIDDARIIQRVLEGEAEAFAGLLEHYEAKIYGLVVRLVGVEAEAEEVTQDAFVQAYTHLADFRAEADFSSWLYRIAYNTALMHLRRRRVATVPMDERLIDNVTDEMAAGALSETTEMRIAMIEEALKRLSPEDRTAVTLFYFEERSTRDIAFVLGTTVSNVTTRLHRARKRLYLLIKQLEHEQER
jgi:RNA polymerase sigma-70 factor (ECF subfamily)